MELYKLQPSENVLVFFIFVSEHLRTSHISLYQYTDVMPDELIPDCTNYPMLLCLIRHGDECSRIAAGIIRAVKALLALWLLHECAR